MVILYYCGVHGNHFYFRTRERLKCAGNILTACEKVQKTPKNNLESALNFLQSEEMLLLDALYEIDEVS